VSNGHIGKLSLNAEQISPEQAAVVMGGELTRQVEVGGVRVQWFSGSGAYQIIIQGGNGELILLS
jgi:hypothetical protein